MKFSEYKNAIETINFQIAQLVEDRQNLKLLHTVPTKHELCEGYTYSGWWREHPEYGISYYLGISSKDGLICEYIDGDFFKRTEVPAEVKSLGDGLRDEFKGWLENLKDWPWQESDNW